MKTYDKIYRIISISNFIIHILLFVFILLASFLPFCGDYNFYEYFKGFFGLKLSDIQPYFIILILLLSCVCSFFVIKRPQLSVLVAILSFSFFIIVMFPYIFEAFIIGFSSPWIGGDESDMSPYKIGFELMGYASYTINLDLTFILYSFITLLVRGIKKENKNEKEY